MAKKGSSRIRDQGHEILVRRLLNEGSTYRQIADVLKEHGCCVSAMSISNFLAEDREERRRVALEVVADQAREAIPKVVNALHLVLDACMREVDDCRGRPKELAGLVKATVGACSELHRICSGENDKDVGLENALAEARRILAERSRAPF
jgi:hypothetical protein